MIKDNKQGFTLIETIVYLAIVAILLMAVISFHLIMANTSTKLSRYVDTSYNRRTALSTIDYLVRNSSGLLRDVNGDCSDFDDSPPVLALYFNNDNYLPGTCVSTGGGVKITVDDYRLKMTCYPGVTNNGEYQACTATSTYSYFLSSPEVRILDSSLSFSTSTATSTASGFTTVITKLAVGVDSGYQTTLAATSTATSTVVLRNQSPIGLISWWKFDDASADAAVDGTGANDLTCSGTPTAQSTALIEGSSYSFDFNKAETDYCYVNNPDNFNFSSAFSISAWIKMDYTDNAEYDIFNKYESATNKGYKFYINQTTGAVVFKICDSSSCTNVINEAGLISDATTYHMTAVYDLNNDEATLYVYQKGVGGVNTTTANSLPTLVNTGVSNYPRVGNNFDGSIDELRIYNRVLTDSEVWALNSQGEGY